MLAERVHTGTPAQGTADGLPPTSRSAPRVRTCLPKIITGGSGRRAQPACSRAGIANSEAEFSREAGYWRPGRGGTRRGEDDVSAIEPPAGGDGLMAAAPATSDR